MHPRGLHLAHTLDGTTGLLRTVSADSGATGTFRVSVIGSYYTGTGFLCGTCAPPGGTATKKDDDVSQMATRLGLSATPVDFLEAYAGLRYQSTSDDRGTPTAIQIVGDVTLGAKAFMPPANDRIFSFGGGVDTRLLSSPGGVGLDAASFNLRALGTMDLTRRTNAEDRIPLRVHLNVGYLFDGSGNLADDEESSRKKVLGANRITRIERFAHDINRVDTLRPALGVEGVFPYVRPFLEYSVDVPVNRQGHDCGNSVSRAAGDSCLVDEGFSAVPSRLTLGARVYPWVESWMEGFGFLAAFDIGTGATSTFIEEIAPERPWALHVGLSWAVDTAPRGEAKIVEKVVERALPPPPEHHIEGSVVVAGKTEPVPGAVIRYVGKTLTGMVADEQGKFRTTNLDPGEYQFAVTADGYQDGQCTAKIPEDEKPAPAKPPAQTPGKPAAPPPPPAPPEPVTVQVSCEIEALPKTATITGVVRDADTTMFVDGANVTITDPLNRQLSLRTDAQGTFRFGNVPAGKSAIAVDMEGYLRGATDIALEARHDVSTQILLHPKPKVSNVVVTKTEIKLKKEVHFLHDSAEILPDSVAILEEAAEVLRSKPDIAHVEVQGHTDDSGTPDYNAKLSAARANAVRDILVANGVEAGRLTAQGYGQDKPLVPNTTPKNRAKNRRVQLVIVP